MTIRKILSLKFALTLILLFFIFSPLVAAPARQPTLSQMVRFYEEKLGKADHVVVEFCLKHPQTYVKRSYIWEYKAIVVFLWRPKMGWVILGLRVFQMPEPEPEKKEI